MPVVSIDELKNAVVSGRIGAITIDTSIVERYQYGFESGVLAKMSQFSRVDTQHLVLDIVLHEMRAHLISQADLVHVQVRNALKPLGNAWGVEKDKRTEALQVLFGYQSSADRTEERLQEFLDTSSSVLLECADFVELPEVLSRYMTKRAPFGNKEAKKHEFPDAIALLALEGWAENNNTRVVAVSGDSDWKRFCADSDRVYFVDDLGQALSAFQTGADDAVALFELLLKTGKLGALDAALLYSIYSQSDKISVDFEGTTSWY